MLRGKLAAELGEIFHMTVARIRARHGIKPQQTALLALPVIAHVEVGEGG